MQVLLVNVLAVLVGSGVGALVKRAIRPAVSQTVMTGIGFCVIYMAITGFDKNTGTILLLIAFALGAFLGEVLDLEGRSNRAGEGLVRALSKGKEGAGAAQGCVSFFLISCGGAYTIMACLEAGLGDPAMLYTKAAMDLVVSMTMSAAMGLGVMLSVVPMVLYQGALMLLAHLLQPLLSEAMLSAVSNAGAIITLAIGVELIGAAKVKPINLLPAVLVAPLLVWAGTLL